MAVKASDVVRKFAPNADATYRKAFAEGGALLDKYDIDTSLLLAHFMAQCMHETAGLTLLV